MIGDRSKVIALMFHDAVENDSFDDSGFPGPGPAIYKLDVRAMESHFLSISSAGSKAPILVTHLLQRKPAGRVPLCLTFDDGGVSAATLIADRLEERSWRGHFFVTAGLVDRPAFLNSRQIRDLRTRGHLIGTHSWSHPQRMSACSWDGLVEEWYRSTARLSDLIGEQITTASVPGGFYSREVARAASFCGIRALFTSEPVKASHQVDDCLVLGRYRITRGMTPSVVAALCSAPHSGMQMKQYARWTLMKAAKFAGGRYYPGMRATLLHLLTGKTRIT